jgi:hypothetical protein
VNIGTVTATGNSIRPSYYDYVDYDVEALKERLLYYRLRQEDKDGHYVYSHIVLVQFARASQQTVVSVYPNPSTGNISLLISSTASRAGVKDKAEIYSIDGKFLYSSNITGWRNNVLMSLNNLPMLPQGIYLLKVYLNGQVFNVKIERE